MDGSFIETGVTCGIEIECDFLTSRHFSATPFSNIWRTTHDASCETDARIANSTGLILKNSPANQIIPTGNVTLGTEINSMVLNSNNGRFPEYINDICKFLLAYGESEYSERSGIHFHISLPRPSFSTLKRIVKLGSHFESLFFRIGGMGYRFRGEKNDSTYCRPITRNGPPCVPFGDNYVQCFNIEDLIKSEETTDFWERYSDCTRVTGRYVPVRYTWLNLYPLAPHGGYLGTLEFRVFNRTLNPRFILSAFSLCRYFVNLCIKSSFFDDFPIGDSENSVYTCSETDRIIDLLNEMADLVKMNMEVYDNLRKIIDMTPEVKLNNDLILSHLSHNLPRRLWRESLYRPTIIKNKPKNPIYVDIHRLRGE